MGALKYPRVRDALNRIRWAGNLDWCHLVVKDRVSGTKEIKGATITRIGRREFDAGDSTIPHYKVILIYVEANGKRVTVWERPT